ncbi:MAG: ribosome silencing factor [Deltaproteobacteria bacterium]|nr:ribosome silencing factor [Deltaproteobacteria bacterium]
MAIKKPARSLAPPKSDGITLRREASRKLAMALVEAGLDKKADRIEVIDVNDRLDYTDYVVLMTGRSDTHVGAIAQAVENQVKLEGRHPRNDARRGSAWIVLDCGDVWVHVFLDEARKYYDIEGLWMDAPRVELPEEMRSMMTAALISPPFALQNDDEDEDEDDEEDNED